MLGSGGFAPAAVAMHSPRPIVFESRLQMPFGVSELPSPKPVRPEITSVRAVKPVKPAPQMSRSASRRPASAAWKATFRSRYCPAMRSSRVMPLIVVSASMVSTTRNMSAMIRIAPRWPRRLMLEAVLIGALMGALLRPVPQHEVGGGDHADALVVERAEVDAEQVVG